MVLFLIVEFTSKNYGYNLIIEAFQTSKQIRKWLLREEVHILLHRKEN